MIMDEGEDSKGKSVKTDLSLVLNMFSLQSHFVCAKKKKKRSEIQCRCDSVPKKEEEEQFCGFG